MSDVHGTPLQFHPYTGNSLVKKDQSRYQDALTGQSYYANPKPTVGVIITNDRDEIVLVKRAFEPFKDTWDLPGGFVEVGESLEEAASREIKEELGVIITSAKYFSSQIGTYAFAGVVYPILDTTFVATVDSEQFLPADDVSEVLFFRLSELPFDQIKMSNIHDVLERYVQSRDVQSRDVQSRDVQSRDVQSFIN
jgi:ADP-ribose pyrophosphatase YjhB (NUDIX family)